jgi:hypothetical protein
MTARVALGSSFQRKLETSFVSSLQKKGWMVLLSSKNLDSSFRWNDEQTSGIAAR